MRPTSNRRSTNVGQTPNGDRWSDEFLDGLRWRGDSLADEALKQILRDDEIHGIATLFRAMNANDKIPPSALFPRLASFFQKTNRLPRHADIARINRGEHVFQKHAFLIALVLLSKSLPEGYAAPNLARILSISNQLNKHTYRRVLGTLEMVLNVSGQGGFQHGGHAVITAQKLRLLHAGVRHLAHRYRPDFSRHYGVPANLEDMLGTIMGFSYLVLEGLRTLDAGLTREEEEDFLYLWLVFACMMGIHPPSKPHSLDYVPSNLDDARAFYDAYRRRHYVTADSNPDGVQLAYSDLRMLKDLLPRWMRRLGLGLLPRLYMQKLMGEAACLRVGIRPIAGHRLLIWFLNFTHYLARPFDRHTMDHHQRFSQLVFQGMINRAYGGPVEFTVPSRLNDIIDMVESRRS